MKNLLKMFIVELKSRKKDYLFLLGLIIGGIIVGLLFMFLLDKHDKLLVINQITAYFDAIKNKDFIYMISLRENIMANIFFVLGIWLLGISVIGMPIILFLVFFRGFLIGFSIATIVYKYGLIGMLISFFHIFPHHLLSIIILMILSYYSLNFSFNLILTIINRKTINFKNITNRYFKVLVVSVISTIFVSLYEVFIVPIITQFLLVFTK